MAKRSRSQTSRRPNRLDAELLAADFGAGSPIARVGVKALVNALGGTESPDVTAARSSWMASLQATFGADLSRLEGGLEALAAEYAVGRETDLLTLLFAVQTYYVLIVKSVAWQAAASARRLLGLGQSVRDAAGGEALRRLMQSVETADGRGLVRHGEAACSDPFAWYLQAWSGPIETWLRRAAEVWQRYDFDSAMDGSGAAGDVFRGLYQRTFPKRLRHVLGEYYTPDWLVEQMLDDVGYLPGPDARLLDPACGSGAFLVSAIRRLRTGWANQDAGSKAGGREALCQAILSSVAGIDLNPLAVVTARANYVMAIGDLLPNAGHVDVPVYLGDSILGRHPGLQDFRQRFDYVVGNPPWIAWDDLPPGDRQSTKPLWQHYGLFSLSGSEARHGGGKKDLSMLMIYAAADRYLKPSGRLAMILTQTVFQTRGAGDGFRRFRLGDAGEYLRVLQVNDLVDARPFAGAANWTATLVLEKGRPTTYPVPYVKCSVDRIRREFEAVPIDPKRSTSPWMLWPGGWSGTAVAWIGPADYKAHLGANTGGANGVYWVTLCDEASQSASAGGRETALAPPKAPSGLVRIRNLADRGKHSVKVEEALVESDLVYPLLRWGDIRRYRAVAAAHLLLAQDPRTRRGIAESLMQDRYPMAHAYLARFRAALERRAAYRRYQSQAAFYSMYDVGPYTLAPIKVVWRRMDRQINAAVVEPADDPRLGLRPVIPQETCVLVAADSVDEAHYLCALLNSSPVGFVVGAHSVRGGKGFGSPGVLDFLAIRRYDPAHAVHRELSRASRQAHQAAVAGHDVAAIQARIDGLATDLWGIRPGNHSDGVETRPR